LAIGLQLTVFGFQFSFLLSVRLIRAALHTSRHDHVCARKRVLFRGKPLASARGKAFWPKGKARVKNFFKKIRFVRPSTHKRARKRVPWPDAKCGSPEDVSLFLLSQSGDNA
jgi:hypothetical protein